MSAKSTRASNRRISDESKNEEEEEDEPVSSKKKRVSNENETKRKSARRGEPSDESDDDESVNGDALTAIQRRRSAAQAQTTSAKPQYSSTANLNVEIEEARKAKVAEGTIKVGEPQRPPEYTPKPNVLAVASEHSVEDLSMMISGATRLVLARQLNGKSLTGNDIIALVIKNYSGSTEKRDHSRLLLQYVRAEVAKRLKDVFGFELFAGEADLKVSDKWHIVNALQNDELRRLFDADNLLDEENEQNKGDAMETDILRGALMVVLSVLMIERGDVSEQELWTGLTKFGMSDMTTTKLRQSNSRALSIPDVLAKLISKGFVTKQKRDGIFYYATGERALNEIGKKSVLLFMMQTCGLALDENDEKSMLKL